MSFDESILKTTAAMKAEGFGILSDIDVQHAMKEKLGKDTSPCRILGACNPSPAYKPEVRSVAETAQQRLASPSVRDAPVAAGGATLRGRLS